MIADLLAPFFRVGMTIWTLIVFAASFVIVHQIMIMNGINPLSNAGGIVPIITFFGVSFALFALATLAGFIVLRSVFSLIED